MPVQLDSPAASDPLNEPMTNATSALYGNLNSPMVDQLADRFAACLLGLALGDATGAPREGGVLERLAWRVLGRTPDGRMRWTDDTQMTLALTESLLACQQLDLDDAAMRMAFAHQWRRGYGPGAAKVLKLIRRGRTWQHASRSVYPQGSWGNGGAMRVAPLALWLAPDAQAVWQAARASAAITHAHPEAQWGAGAMALAVHTALAASPLAQPQVLGQRFWNAWALSVAAQADPSGAAPYQAPMRWAQLRLQSAQAPSPREVMRQLGCEVSARRSVVTAVYLAAHFLAQPLTDLLGFITRMHGDVDTVAAMAGAIWGAANGRAALPVSGLARLEAAQAIENLAHQLAALRAKTMPII